MVGVLDVDYARVAGRSLPERWDIDVVGFLVMERQDAADMPGQEFWRQIAFHTFRDQNLSDLRAVAGHVDLIIGHNLFDGDYRCLRTYGDVVDVGVLAAKTVDTLYAARHVVGGGRNPCSLRTCWPSADRTRSMNADALSWSLLALTVAIG